jgi:hypothetical protein
MTDRDLTSLQTSNEFSIDRWHFAKAFTLEGTGEPPTYEQWAKVQDFITTADTRTQWWWGDWYNYGELAFGELASQAITAPAWKLDTLRQYAFIAGRVPVDNRRPDEIPFYMYRPLAKLTVQQQAVWVDKILEALANGDKWNEQVLLAKIDGREDPRTVDRFYVQVLCTDEAEQGRLVEKFTEQGYDASPVTRKKKV